MNTIIIDPYYTLIIATLVLLVGRLLVTKIKLLRDFNIPEPVAGGLLAAVVIYLLYIKYEISLDFNTNLQDAFMLFFFSSIGLSADFSRLKAGGKGLIIFLGVVALFIVVQNSVGVGLASALGQNPIMGLITGSITLTGGHGTAGAWGKILETKYHIEGATSLGMASATFGLVLGGLIGGPVARKLVNNLGRKPVEKQNDNVADTVVEVFENAGKQRLITSKSAIETMALFGRWPQRFCATWSSICTAATPARSKLRIVRAILNAPPQPTSMSTSKGVSTLSVIRRASISTSSIVVIPKSGIPHEQAATPPPDRYTALNPLCVASRAK